MSRHTTLSRRVAGTIAAAALAAGGFAAAAPLAMAAEPTDIVTVVENLDLSYPSVEVEAGTVMTVHLLGGSDLIPEGSSVTVDSAALPAGVTASVDALTGSLTVEVADTVAPGTVVSVPVVVSVPNPLGEPIVVTTSASITVIASEAPGEDPQADTYSVSYPATIAHYGETITVAPVTDAPEGTVFEIAALSVPQGVSIDPDTGVVTIVVPTDRQVRGLTLPLRAVYSDGSRDNTSLVITVTEENTDPGDDNGGSLPSGSLGSLGDTGSLSSIFGSLGN